MYRQAAERASSQIQRLSLTIVSTFFLYAPEAFVVFTFGDCRCSVSSAIPPPGSLNSQTSGGFLRDPYLDNFAYMRHSWPMQHARLGKPLSGCFRNVLWWKAVTRQFLRPLLKLLVYLTEYAGPCSISRADQSSLRLAFLWRAQLEFKPPIWPIALHAWICVDAPASHCTAMLKPKPPV